MSYDACTMADHENGARMAYFSDESTDFGGLTLFNEPGTENIEIRFYGGKRVFAFTRSEVQDFLDRAYGVREVEPRVVIRGDAV